MDFLDIALRLEKAFAIKIRRGEFVSTDLDPRALTVGQLHDHLVGLMSKWGNAVPPDSWERVRRCVGEALFVDPAKITRSDRLIADLGAS